MPGFRQFQNVMSSSLPSWVWASSVHKAEWPSEEQMSRGSCNLLGEDEAESGVRLQSLRSKLSPFLDSTSQTMSITALFDHVDTPPVRRVARARRSLFWQLFAVGSQGGAVVLSGS